MRIPGAVFGAVLAIAGVLAQPQVACAADKPPLTMCFDTDEASTGSDGNIDVARDTADDPRTMIVMAAFHDSGREVRLVNAGPWKRCLRQVELGYIDFALGAYYDAERTKLFVYSDHYTTLTPSVFFLKAKNLQIHQLGDLRKYHGCGLYGYSYSHFGVNNADLDLGADYRSLYLKMQAGRCDYFLDEVESFVNGYGEQVFLKNDQMMHVTADWAVAPSNYVIASKTGPNVGLLKSFNDALRTMIGNGSAEKIWKSKGNSTPYRP